MLGELIAKIKENNLEAVKAIYDEFKGYNLDFVLNNEDEKLAPMWEEGMEPISMLNATPLQVAIGSGNRAIIDYLLERKGQSVVPRGEFINPELDYDDPPNLVEFQDEFLQHECKTLMICIAKRDWASLIAIWRRQNCWESANFYKVIETLIKLNEADGLR